MVQNMMTGTSGTHPLNLMGLPPQIPAYLGSAYDFSLVGLSFANVGATTANGNIGSSTPSMVSAGVSGGDVFGGDAVGIKAVADVQDAHSYYRSLTSAATLPGELSGLVLTPGVRHSVAGLTCATSITLDGSGYPVDAMFIFQTDGGLTFGAASSMTLINCNANQVVWVADGGVTLGAGCNVAGTFIAQAAASVNSGAILFGRALSFAGATTTTANTITTQQS